MNKSRLLFWFAAFLLAAAVVFGRGVPLCAYAAETGAVPEEEESMTGESGQNPGSPAGEAQIPATEVSPGPGEPAQEEGEQVTAEEEGNPEQPADTGADSSGEQPAGTESGGSGEQPMGAETAGAGEQPGETGAAGDPEQPADGALPGNPETPGSPEISGEPGQALTPEQSGDTGQAADPEQSGEIQQSGDLPQTDGTEETEAEEAAETESSDGEQAEELKESTGEELPEDAGSGAVLLSRGRLSLDQVTPAGDSAGQMVTVTVEGVEGRSGITIPLGVFGELGLAAAVAGYEFTGAFVDGVEVRAIFYDGNTGYYYVTLVPDAVTGIVVSPEEVVLRYRREVQYLGVSFVLKDCTSGEELDAAGRVEFTGARQFRNGEDYSFGLGAEKGYVIREVSYTAGEESGTLYSGEGMAQAEIFVISGAAGPVTITALTDETTSYQVSFHGSNTTFKYGGESFPGYSGSKHGITTRREYQPQDQLVLTIVGNAEWNNLGKYMNKLTISVDGESFTAGIPDLTGEENSVTTALSHPLSVRVTKLSSGTGSAPKASYSVILSAEAPYQVRGSLDFEGNFKDIGRSEVWVKRLDGTDPVAYYAYRPYPLDGGEARYYLVDEETETPGNDQYMRLDPTNYSFFSRHNTLDKKSWYFFRTKDGYSPDDLRVEVRNYHGDGTYVTLRNSVMSALPTITGSAGSIGQQNARKLTSLGYKYCFSLPGGTSGAALEDVRIFVSDESERSIRIMYDTAGGTADGETVFMTDDRSLAEGDFHLLSDRIPAREGYVFGGWTYENTSGLPGEILTVTGSMIDNAERDGNGDKYYVLHALWIPENEAVDAPYTLKVYFRNAMGIYEDGTGGTGDSPALVIRTGRGVIGRAVHVDTAALEQRFAAGYPEGWADRYRLYRIDNSERVRADGSAVVRVYYSDSSLRLTVRHRTEGNMADGREVFTYTIRLVNSGGAAPAAEGLPAMTGGQEVIIPLSGGAGQFGLSGESSMEITVPGGCTAEVALLMSDAQQSAGYQGEVISPTGAETDQGALKVTAAMSRDHEAQFTMRREISAVPTGITGDRGMWLAAAGISLLAGLFLITGSRPAAHFRQRQAAASASSGHKVLE